MSKMELIKEYIKEYIKDNNVTGKDVQRLYDEAWELCKPLLNYISRSTWMEYMKY